MRRDLSSIIRRINAGERQADIACGLGLSQARVSQLLRERGLCVQQRDGRKQVVER